MGCIRCMARMGSHGSSTGRCMTHVWRGRFDAHLTEEGWRQAEALNAHIKACGLEVRWISAR
jgi:broad specificity phosphatase PhoE